MGNALWSSNLFWHSDVFRESYFINCYYHLCVVTCWSSLVCSYCFILVMEGRAQASLPGFKVLPLRQFGSWGTLITNEFDPERDTYVLVSTSPNMASNHLLLTKQFTRWRDMQLIICFWEFEQSSIFTITTLSSSFFSNFDKQLNGEHWSFWSMVSIKWKNISKVILLHFENILFFKTS